MTKQRRQNSRLVATGFALVLAIVVPAVLVLLGSSHVSSLLDAISQGRVRVLALRLHSLRADALSAVVVLVLAHSVIPFPAELLEAASGFALGAAVALPVLLGSFVASAALAYWVGLRFGRPLASAVVGSRRLGQAERVVERAGVRGLVAIRIFPLIPFSPVCLACGIARVPFWRYIWTTAVGLLPEMALVTYLGSKLQAVSPYSAWIWVPLTGVLLLLIGAPALFFSRGRGG